MGCNKEIYTFKKTCRVCGSKNLIKYFDFGDMPLANTLVKPGQKEETKIPLEVMYCNDCSNSQLSVVVDPEFLFSHYLYHSSVSKTFQEHCSKFAEYAKTLFNNMEGLKILDIGSNDGSLLKEFKAKGFEAIGVEPARNICKKADESGIRTICAFWNRDAAEKVIKEYGNADVVTATNVFAHVDDLYSFVSAVSHVLSDEGVFMIEFPYMRNLIKYKEFDTIYHEHLSYFLVKPLIRLFSMHKMHICNLSEFDIHGGTIRVSVIKDSNSTIKTKEDIIKKYLDMEAQEGLHTIKPYKQLEEEAKKIKEEFLGKLKEIKSKGKKIAGYGASAKGNVFVNYCGLGRDDIGFIVDDTKAKQGLFYPGTKIPIVPNNWISKEKPDYILILPWNFADEIMKKTAEYRAGGGKYIIAVHKLKII